uniref:Translation initiation factor 3 N-terminal domain-containing protein n=1 Tax=Populus alba TaxID=43335 RepID=A0A4V6A0I3_POPAL|nr:hypothetical protein D5086_0000301090 [Populus alba]
MAGITSTSGSSCFPLLTRITATKMTPFIITSHYGGPRSYGDSRRPRKSDSDGDQALDKSRISSATVRLIDQQQNMVGVVPVREAIQMAEDAELDLVIVFTRCRPSGSQDNGLQVKVIVNLNWRENEFRNIAIELIRRIQNFVGELATEESKNFHDRNIFISLVPNKAILQKALEPPKKKNKSAANEVSAGMSACKFTRGFNYGTLGPDHIL